MRRTLFDGVAGPGTVCRLWLLTTDNESDSNDDNDDDDDVADDAATDDADDVVRRRQRRRQRQRQFGAKLPQLAAPRCVAQNQSSVCLKRIWSTRECMCMCVLL